RRAVVRGVRGANHTLRTTSRLRTGYRWRRQWPCRTPSRRHRRVVAGASLDTPRVEGRARASSARRCSRRSRARRTRTSVRQHHQSTSLGGGRMSEQHSRSKVTARHLGRDAYLYVRQSSLRQVIENTESTQRQYALRQRAVALGWTADRIIVIDSDLGQSGAYETERVGLQRLVADVGMGRAGIVLGLEVSRLARNSTDWHRLLEICALTDTLILDEDGIYDPAHFNDRLLLGLKGTMSEAELHLLRARLRGGAL